MTGRAVDRLAVGILVLAAVHDLAGLVGVVTETPQDVRLAVLERSVSLTSL